ncbi:hypothetical protein [Sorangium sp. So ce406]|uniref:hypothetical protein n=1 Tax=Sorangium sp. So ce406 TaxID=3133311 RepID=UPI003F5B2A3B
MNQLACDLCRFIGMSSSFPASVRLITSVPPIGAGTVDDDRVENGRVRRSMLAWLMLRTFCAGRNPGDDVVISAIARTGACARDGTDHEITLERLGRVSRIPWELPGNASPELVSGSVMIP